MAALAEISLMSFHLAALIVSPQQTGDGLDEIQEPDIGRLARIRAVQKVP